MSKEKRQEQEQVAMRQLILTTASELVAENGIDKLSIRKIADRMDYSAGIIYHYFAGKEDIVEQLLRQGYQEIIIRLTSSSQLSQEQIPAEDRFRHSLSAFIRMGIDEGAQYRNVMLNESAAVLSHTAVLHKGASQERNAIGMLCTILREMGGDSSRNGEEIELTAQVIWSAAFGLVMRLTVEKNLPNEQREALIARHVEAMLIVARS